MKTLICVFVLVFTINSLSCNKHENAKVNYKVKVTDFVEDVGSVISYNYYFDDYSYMSKASKNLNNYLLPTFWNNKLTVKPHIFDAKYISKRNEVIVYTTQGIYIWGGKKEKIMQTENIIPFPIWDCDTKYENIAFVGRSSLSQDYFIIFLDLLNGNEIKRPVPNFARGLKFTDNNSILVTYLEETDSPYHCLIELSLDDNNNNLASKKIKEKCGNVVSVFNNSPVFYFEGEKFYRVSYNWGENSFEFEKPIDKIMTTSNYIWLLDYEGKLLHIDKNNTIENVSNLTPDDVIGLGVENDFLWIAFVDGIVKSFPDEKVLDNISEYLK